MPPGPGDGDRKDTHMRRTVPASSYVAVALTVALTAIGLCAVGARSEPAAGRPLTGLASLAARPAAHPFGGDAAGRDGIGAVAPERGVTVLAKAARADGREESLTVATGRDGTVTITAEGPGAERGAGATQVRPATATAGCADGSYTLEGFRVIRTLPFYYNPANAPANVRSTALTAIRNATHAVATGANRCAITRRLNSGATYSGATGRAAQLGAAGKCTGNDGHNVVGWGSLPSGYLAVTCIYYSDGKVLNSDVLINWNYRWFTSRPADCSNAFDVQSVVVHEQGHTFGLGHVDAKSHRAQTMATSLAACDISKRALGLGDYRGLAHIYGTR